jgi:DNA-binding NarL/FixJ family response regulator
MSASANPIRVLTVDDHPLLREGIAALVSTQPDMKIIAEASTGREAIQQFRTWRPDVTLMDVQMPEIDGIEALITIRDEFPDARVIVLTSYTGDVQAMRALKAGAKAYLLKGLAYEELMDAIRDVHAGRKHIAQAVATALADHVSEDAVSEREADVLRLIACGHSNKLIASRLCVSEDTVKGRVKRILSKLRANDRTHAAMIGLKRGIIDS